MQDWNELRVFKAIADAGSLVGASASLGLPRSTVSKRLADLEGRLGHRLFKRTTRRVALTEAGQSLFASVRQAFEILERGQAALVEERQKSGERVTLSAPPVLAQNVIGLLAGELIRSDPALHVEVRSEIGGDGANAAEVDIRLSAHPMGVIPPGGLIVGHSRRGIYAAPSFLARRGTPETPRDIAADDLVMRSPAEPLVVLRGSKRATLLCRGRLHCVDHETVRDAAVSGTLLGVLPRFVAAPAHAAGSLVQVLPDWRFPAIPIVASAAPFARARAVVRRIMALLPSALERAGLAG